MLGPRRSTRQPARRWKARDRKRHRARSRSPRNRMQLPVRNRRQAQKLQRRSRQRNVRPNRRPRQRRNLQNRRHHRRSRGRQAMARLAIARPSPHQSRLPQAPVSVMRAELRLQKTKSRKAAGFCRGNRKKLPNPHARKIRTRPRSERRSPGGYATGEFFKARGESPAANHGTRPRRGRGRARSRPLRHSRDPVSRAPLNLRSPGTDLRAQANSP